MCVCAESQGLCCRLMFAAGGGHNDTTRLLIESGADVNRVVVATPGYIEQMAKAVAEGKEDVEPHKVPLLGLCSCVGVV